MAGACFWARVHHFQTSDQPWGFPNGAEQKACSSCGQTARGIHATRTCCRISTSGTLDSDTIEQFTWHGNLTFKRMCAQPETLESTNLKHDKPKYLDNST
eukprot:4167656-Amphidinium_carterae.1